MELTARTLFKFILRICIIESCNVSGIAAGRRCGVAKVNICSPFILSMSHTQPQQAKIIAVKVVGDNG